MRNRWGILAVLFVVRLSMGFQFQSVGGAYAGNAAAAFDFGALTILACPPDALGFNQIPAAAPKEA